MKRALIPASSHLQHAQRSRVSTPCHAAHLTFGGHCLNCGYGAPSVYGKLSAPNSAHGYDKKRFPLTAAQGRVLYHLERLFRSTGHGTAQYQDFLADVRAYGLDVRHVAAWSAFDCVQALALMEYDSRPMAGYRPLDTGRADFMPNGRFAP